MVEGGAIAVALWCTLYIFQLLPGRTADTEGVLLFAIAGAILRLTPIGKSLLPALTLCSLVVLAVSESSVSNAVASEWIRCDPIPDSGIAAVVVMSAGVNPNGTMSAEALDHLLTGLELTRGDSAPLLVTTTVQQMFPTGMVSSQTDQGRIVALAGGRRRWMRMRSTRSTRDEALTVGDSLLPRGMRRVAVVASPMHTRRACGAFAAVGFDVTCVAARSRLPGGASPGPWPRDRLTVFGDWVYEVAGTTKYRMKGWLDSGAERKSNVSPSMNPGTAAAAVAAPRHTWCE
jgi:uncharacterized SAM-binding protein YcdF (DUF218 family)